MPLLGRRVVRSSLRTLPDPHPQRVTAQHPNSSCRTHPGHRREQALAGLGEEGVCSRGVGFLLPRK
eukprot:13917662-Alexandrium_andersonii.AAC.1